jgi:hypothetical protein
MQLSFTTVSGVKVIILLGRHVSDSLEPLGRPQARLVYHHPYEQCLKQGLHIIISINNVVVINRELDPTHAHHVHMLKM